MTPLGVPNTEEVFGCLALIFNKQCQLLVLIGAEPYPCLLQNLTHLVLQFVDRISLGRLTAQGCCPENTGDKEQMEELHGEGECHSISSCVYLLGRRYTSREKPGIQKHLGGEMNRTFKGLVATFALCAFAQVSFAHHGRGSTFDMSKMTELKGTVKEVQWRNPHVGIFVDVKDESGKVVTWAIEHSNVITLAEEGYNRNTLKPGQEVTVVINAGTGGKPIGYLYKIILTDGKEIFLRRGTN
jgi:hypothetical protein